MEEEKAALAPGADMPRVELPARRSPGSSAPAPAPVPAPAPAPSARQAAATNVTAVPAPRARPAGEEGSAGEDEPPASEDEPPASAPVPAPAPAPSARQAAATNLTAVPAPRARPAGEEGSAGEDEPPASEDEPPASGRSKASAACALLKLVQGCVFRWEDHSAGLRDGTKRWTEAASKFAQDARAAQAASLLSVSDYFGAPTDAADFVHRLCHQLESWLHLDLNGDGYVGTRAESGSEMDAKQSAEGRQRFIVLLQSLGQVQRGEALLEANFPEEAELRMNFAALEFGRAQDRDSVLFFKPISYGIASAPLNRSLLSMYACFARLADMHYQRAAGSRRRVAELAAALRDQKTGGGLLPPRGADDEQLRTALGIARDHHAQLVRRAEELLLMWVRCLERISSWYVVGTASHSEPNTPSSRSVASQLTGCSAEARFVPPPAVGILSCRMLIHTLYEGQHTTAARLYEVGKEWLDLTVHETIDGIPWTAKALARCKAHEAQFAAQHVTKAAAAQVEHASQERAAQVDLLEAHAKLSVLSDRMPDLLQTAVLGEWNGHIAFEMMVLKYFTLAQSLACSVVSLVDMGLDAYVIQSWLSGEDENADAGTQRNFAIISIGLIAFTVFIQSCCDRLQSERNSAGEELDTRISHQSWALSLRPLALWKRLLLNVTMMRLPYESVHAVYAWRLGYKPSAAFEQIRMVEGLFEALPHTLIQTYVLLVTYRKGRDLDSVLLLSTFSSILVAAYTIASMGYKSTILWRLTFFSFLVLQMMLRVASLCGMALVVVNQCNAAETSQHNGQDPVYCHAGQFVLIVSYAFASWAFGVIFHVIHLQGHAGGSLRRCHKQDAMKRATTIKEARMAQTKSRDSTIRRIAVFIKRATIFDRKNLSTYIISFINTFVAFDSSPYAVLSQMDPRPPRIPFFLFRLAEIYFAGHVFHANLRTDVLFPFEMDLVLQAGCVLMVALYLLCLLVPYKTSESTTPSAIRALSLGLTETPWRLSATDRTSQAIISATQTEQSQRTCADAGAPVARVKPVRKHSGRSKSLLAVTNASWRDHTNRWTATHTDLAATHTDLDLTSCAKSTGWWTEAAVAATMACVVLLIVALISTDLTNYEGNACTAPEGGVEGPCGAEGTCAVISKLVTQQLGWLGHAQLRSQYGLDLSDTGAYHCFCRLPWRFNGTTCVLCRYTHVTAQLSVVDCHN